MISKKLNRGDMIGIISPSHVASPERYEKIIHSIELKGFIVRKGKNLYKNTYGYLATEEERSNDLNEMVLDNEIKMIFFGGGTGSIELLPYINYNNIKKNPKIFLSYSDGTTILNAIYSKTGLITYYGQTPSIFENITQYDFAQFSSHFLEDKIDTFISNSKWYSLNEGICTGILIGGYCLNFALLVNSDYFIFNKHEKYVLFLEDHEKFESIDFVSTMISYIEQSAFANNIAGLIFGHYATKIYPDLMERLKRFGKKYNVPVVYCDDFGHGANHAILPIGCKVLLDTEKNVMNFLTD